MPTTTYATLAQLKVRLDLTADDPEIDDALDRVIASASRAIDKVCDRRFYQLAATTKTYTPECGDTLAIDDLVSVTSLVTDQDGDRTYETTWLVTDYDLTPDNAAADGLPYTRIELSPRTTKWFPVWRRSVQVTGTWGWPAVPEPVTEATLILATRYFRRPTLPFGLAGSPELAPMAELPAVDPDAKALLAPYRRFSVVAV